MSLLLAWEGALVAGVFVAALGHVALTAYAMERHDERVRWGSGWEEDGRAGGGGRVTRGALLAWQWRHGGLGCGRWG